MRDLAITVVVALLIVLAGFRFWGYQQSLLESPGPGRGEGVEEEYANNDDKPIVVPPKKEDKPAVTTKPVVPAVTTPVTPKPATGSVASIEIADQPAGLAVQIKSLSLPVGPVWVAVHEGSRTLGAKLFQAGATTGTVELLRTTTKGQEYTVSIRKDNGDGAYNRQADAELQDASGKAILVAFKAL